MPITVGPGNGSQPPRPPDPKKGQKGGKGGGASKPGKGGQNPAGPTTTAISLNPPFDPRMRRVGSPLNQSHRIKRGWIQDKASTKRVDFLFNPNQLDISAGVDPTAVETDFQDSQTQDVTSPMYVSTGMSLGFKLLYDRTYELFSSTAANNSQSPATLLGVYADVAAWYNYMGMLKEMPLTWEEGLITGPAQMVMSYLFIGPRLVYYGWPTSINVVYSHWTQNMVPARCALDISFEIMPYVSPEGMIADLTNPSNFYSFFGWGRGGGDDESNQPDHPIMGGSGAL